MAVLLQGVNDESLSTTTVPYTTLGANGLTFACWFRNADATFNSRLWRLLQDGTNEAYQLRTTTSPGQQAVSSDGVTTATSTGAPSHSQDVWFHAAAVFDGESSRTVYKDGTAGTENTTTVAPTGLDLLFLGARTVTEGADGYLAHAALWKRALSAAEVDALAKGESPRYLPVDLWAYLPLLSDSRDEVGNASWTENGTLSWDATIDPLIRRTRLGAYGGARQIYGLFGPKAGAVAVSKDQQNRLGAYGGPRQLYGAFAPKTAAVPAEVGRKYRGLAVNPGRLLSR